MAHKQDGYRFLLLPATAILPQTRRCLLAFSGG